jgi:RIO kinase 1
VRTTTTVPSHKYDELDDREEFDELEDLGDHEYDADSAYDHLADGFAQAERVRGRTLLTEQEQRAEKKLLRRGRLTDRERERLAERREEQAHAPALPEGADRWSTWGEGESGPAPRPSWLVTADGAVDSLLGVVKSGKEADVHLVERWLPDAVAGSDPDSGSGSDALMNAHVDAAVVGVDMSADALGMAAATSCLLAEKIYRGNDHRDFHRDAGYLDGRRTRESRLDRAVDNRSRFGLKVIAEQWAVAEFAALSRLWQAGAPVPYPVQRVGTDLLLEFIGSADGTAAPRLAALRPEPDELADLWEQLCEALGYLARAGYAHGDLSPYNVLVYEGRLVLIDLPQIVDLTVNPRGGEYLARDVANIASWFAARSLPDASRRSLELVDRLRYDARLD